MSSKLSATWLVAAREYEWNLVAQQELGARHLQVADVNRDVLRLGRAAEDVNDLEVLAQLDQIAEILERSRPPPARGVHDVGRPGGRSECDATVRQRHVALRIHRMQSDVVRRRGERGAHQIRGSSRTDQRRFIDLGAGVAVQNARIGRQNLHALGFQNDERCIVYRGDLVV